MFMPDYKKMYLLLFNAVTDALAKMRCGNTDAAEMILKTAQQNTEEMYIQDKKSSA